MAIAEITKTESAQRAGLLRVRSYDVALDLTRGEGEFGSESVIRFDCAQPGAASYADLVARTVHEITLNGLSLDPSRACADGRITLMDLAASRAARALRGEVLRAATGHLEYPTWHAAHRARPPAVPVHRGLARAAPADG